MTIKMSLSTYLIITGITPVKPFLVDVTNFFEILITLLSDWLISSTPARTYSRPAITNRNMQRIALGHVFTSGQYEALVDFY